MMLSWAYVLLGRTTLAYAALARVDAALETMQGSGAEVADLRVEARIVDACVRAMADRPEGIDDLVGECLSRPDTLWPLVVSVAANVATFAALPIRFRRSMPLAGVGESATSRTAGLTP